MTREAPLEEPPIEVVMDVLDLTIDVDITAVTRVEEGLNGVYHVEGSAGESWMFKLATLNDNAELRVEAYLLERIEEQTGVPVPRLITAVEPESNRLPGFAYLMTAIDGRRLRDVMSLPRAGRERFVEEVGGYLAKIHDLGTATRFGEPRLHDGELTVPVGHEEIGPWLTEQAANAAGKLRGEGYVTDDEPRFIEFAGPVETALSDPNLDSNTVEPALTHGDPRPANMIFAQTDTGRPLVRGLLDVGGPITDGLSDLANAEVALIDVPLGGTDEADHLRSRLRSAYESERAVGPVGDLPRYTRYRLLHRARTLAGFGWWKQFAREASEEAAAHRFRSEARTLLRQIQ